MFVIDETTQSEMGPYFIVVDSIWSWNSWTAVLREVAFVKVCGGGGVGSSVGGGGGRGAVGGRRLHCCTCYWSSLLPRSNSAGTYSSCRSSGRMSRPKVESRPCRTVRCGSCRCTARPAGRPVRRPTRRPSS